MLASDFALAFVTVLAVLRFFSVPIARRLERHHSEVVSFSAGVFLSYFFLALFPVLLRAPPSAEKELFAAMLLGLAAFHLVEKYVYQHVSNRRQLISELGELHALGSFADSFIVGFALVFVMQAVDPAKAYFALIPFVVHMLASSLSTAHILEHFSAGVFGNAVLASAPIAGALAAGYLQLNPHYFFIIFSFMLGVILYSVLRGILPQKRKGRPLYFFAGLALTWALLYFLA
ncbi:MAG: hypothetical protein V1787_00540 [Candidatus Micrarchaeota archaeon]